MRKIFTLQDYIHSKDSSLENFPNEVDYAALTCLSYIKFEYIKENIIEMRLNELKKAYPKPKVTEPRLNTYYNFFESMADSPRYKDIRVLDFVAEDSLEYEMQFASIAFLLPNDEIFVAFRGTDITLMGWKEDANMAFLDSIPSEEMASATLMRLMYQYPDKTFSVGGHSKGGRVALGSTSSLPKELQDRIKVVIDMDSPGLSEKLYESEGYLNILPKVHSFIPNMSVVGLIFRKKQKVTIIKSYAPSILQHDAFYWGVLNQKLECIKEVESGEELEEGAFNKIMKALSVNETHDFLDLIYSLFQDETKSFTLIEAIDFKNMIKAVKKYVKMSKEDKNKLMKVTKTIIATAIKKEPKKAELVQEIKEE